MKTRALEARIPSGARMKSTPPADVGRWRKVVELGSGQTGSVALCIEPESPSDDKTCVERRHGVFHAVKRVNKQYARNNAALRRVLQEKKALQALGGVREDMPNFLALSASLALAGWIVI